MGMEIKNIIKTIVFLPETGLNYLWNSFQFKRWHVQKKRGLKVNGRMYISGTGICIGENVRINSCLKANPVGGDCRTILRTSGDGELIIGDNTGLSNVTIVAYQSVRIGENVLLGGSCKIYDTDFHSLDLQTRISKPLEGVAVQPVVIEDGAFVGAHAIILKGVTIGKGSIVGAGSVVTKSIPEGEIWGGNPAKFIRKICQEN